MEALIIIAISIALFYGAFQFRLKTKKISVKGVEAEGIVFYIVESDNINSHANYPVIRFLTSEKEWITEEYDISAGPNLFKKGQRVSVIYNPDNPREFFIKSESTILMPVLAIILAVILLAVGLYKLYI